MRASRKVVVCKDTWPSLTLNASMESRGCLADDFMLNTPKGQLRRTDTIAPSIEGSADATALCRNKPLPLSSKSQHFPSGKTDAEQVLRWSLRRDHRRLHNRLLQVPYPAQHAGPGPLSSRSQRRHPAITPPAQRIFITCPKRPEYIWSRRTVEGTHQLRRCLTDIKCFGAPGNLSHS